MRNGPLAHAAARAASLVGLAFNTKTLAAYLVVPGDRARLSGLRARRRSRGACCSCWRPALVAGVVSFAWIAVVELTPASQRPYVGSSTDNTELGLTFNYNGFGRVEGQVRRPRPDARQARRARCAKSPPSRASTAHRARGHSHIVPPPSRKRAPDPAQGGARTQPGPLRRLARAVAPVRRRARRPGRLDPAVRGVRACSRRCSRCCCRAPADGETRTGRRPRPTPGAPVDSQPPAPLPGTPGVREQASGWRDPRLAATIVLGGWFLVEAAVLSPSKGIVHPYYVSALAPGHGRDGRDRARGRSPSCAAGAKAGLGSSASRSPRLPCCARVVAEVVLMHR